MADSTPRPTLQVKGKPTRNSARNDKDRQLMIDGFLKFKQDAIKRNERWYN
jgi:hypothetical protein